MGIVIFLKVLQRNKQGYVLLLSHVYKDVNMPRYLYFL